MKTRILLLTLLINSCILTISRAQTDQVTRKIIEMGKTDNQTMDHLDVLCNRIGGRLAGSDAYNNAVEWAAAEMRSWGMEVRVEEAGSVPVGFNRGPWFGRLLGENGMVLHFATPSYTSGTKGVQTGPVLIEPKSQEEFDRMKGLLKGAWVLIGGSNNGYPIDISAKADKKRDSIIEENNKIATQNREIEAANWRGEPKKELIKLKEEPALFYRQMREAGILGIIQSAKVPIQAMYDRKNMESMTFENLPTVPDIKLDEHQYEIIKQMVVERRNFLLEFDIRNHFKPGPVKFHNVIGVIKGSKYPDEYVIMGSHLDAYDVATGGVDDGSGIAPTMEAARLIMAAGGKPKRTILVCLFAAEEFGLVGSHSWVDHNKDKLASVSNMFNRDYGPLAPTSLSVSEAQWDDFTKICEPLKTLNPQIPFELKKREARPRPKTAGGSDHAPFAVEGVPTISFGIEDVAGYNFNYGEIWHTERDLYNKSIPDYQNHAAVCTAVVVYGVANLDHLLSREGFFTEEKAIQ
ncbi:MAG TPA: M28 family peptidase [Lentimicrobium sp.]|nr:M28 family peptidase [Lentimicrobium sp.]